MAEKDNLTASPASGFGQVVSFTFDPSKRPASQMQAGQRSELRAGVRGGQSGRIDTSGPNIAAVAPDPTVVALMKMGQEFLAPKIKAKQQQKFVEGMGKAAAGQAMKDIVAEQPWYADFFGDTDVVEGARAYHSQAAVAKAAADMEDAMPDLRKLPPAQAQQEVNRRLSENLTGDASVDSHLLAATAKMLPGVLRQHAKAHYSYLQEEASAAESTARHSDADLLQKSAKGLIDGTISPEDYALRAEQSASRARPALGRNLESYAKTLADDLSLMARRGQLHAVNAYRKGGYIDALPPDLARQVEVAIDTSENTLRGQYSFEWGDEIAALKFKTIDTRGTTQEQYFAQVRDLNDRFKKVTGSTRDLMGLTETVTDMEQMGRAIHAHNERAVARAEKQREDLMKAGQEAAAKQITASMVMSRVLEGDVIQAKRVPGAKDEDVHVAVEQAFAAKGPEVLRRAFKQSNGYVNPLIKARFTAGLRGALTGEMTTAARDSYLSWRALRDLDNTGALAASYFGDGDLDKRMEIFHVLSGGNPDTPQALHAHRAAFINPLTHKPNTLDKGEMAALASSVVSEFSDNLPSFLGGKPSEGELRPEAAAELTRHTQRYFEVWSGAVPGIDHKRAFRLAINSAKQDGVQIEGGFFWKDARGERPIQAMVAERLKSAGVAMPDGQVDTARLWRGAIEGVLGADSKLPLSLMRDNNNGLMAVVQSQDGPPRFRHIPVQALADQMNVMIRKATGSTGSTPAITGKVRQPDQP